MQSVLILGRQPELGLAELESLYGTAAVSKIGKTAALVDVDPCLLAFDRLGGSQKFCKLLTTLDTINWKQIEKFLYQAAPAQLSSMPAGKMHLGLSVIGLEVSLGKLESTGLTLKKAIRKVHPDRSVRLVPNKQLELGSAQVIHNNLTTPTGWELVFIKHGDQTIVAQTVKVQDIESYTRRDRERPRRDARVGMLPPKLAQILINLAVGRLPEDQLSSICDTPADQAIPRPHLSQTVLDPFCGTGVLLQEALLMGYDIQGTDLEPRMISYAQQNLDWLQEHNAFSNPKITLQAGDATTHSWQPPINSVAAETYLGRPFTTRPNAETLAQTVSDCNSIIKKFLKNLQPQLQPGTRICLAIPAWQTSPNNFKKLPLIDSLADLGYNQVRFEQADGQDLIYYRSDQIVGRQLLTIIRN